MLVGVESFNCSCCGILSFLPLPLTSSSSLVYHSYIIRSIIMHFSATTAYRYVCLVIIVYLIADVLFRFLPKAKAQGRDDLWFYLWLYILILVIYIKLVFDFLDTISLSSASCDDYKVSSSTCIKKEDDRMRTWLERQEGIPKVVNTVPMSKLTKEYDWTGVGIVYRDTCKYYLSHGLDDVSCISSLG